MKLVRCTEDQSQVTVSQRAVQRHFDHLVWFWKQLPLQCNNPGVWREFKRLPLTDRSQYSGRLESSPVSLCQFSHLSVILSKISIKLSNPNKYPSSRLPSCQGILWSKVCPSGRRVVFPKSISHTLAFLLLSCTKSSELPMTCREKSGGYDQKVIYISPSLLIYPAKCKALWPATTQTAGLLCLYSDNLWAKLLKTTCLHCLEIRMKGERNPSKEVIIQLTGTVA